MFSDDRMVSQLPPTDIQTHYTDKRIKLINSVNGVILGAVICQALHQRWYGIENEVESVKNAASGLASRENTLALVYF